MESINLTGGIVVCPEIKAPTTEGGRVLFELLGAAPDYIKGMVYVAIADEGNGLLSITGVTAVTEPGQDRKFAGSVVGGAASTFCYAYGIVSADGSDLATYGNASGSIDDEQVTLLVDMLAKNGSYAFTRTFGEHL